MTFVRLTIALILLGLVFSVTERLFPAIKGKRVRRSGARLDVWYWFFTPVVTRSISRVTTLVAVVLTAAVIGREIGPELADGYGPIAALPSGVVVILMLLVGDFNGYWMHRAFHSRRLWKFHAIHHSSRELDWLSSVRLHPLNDIIARLIQVIPLVCLGFPLKPLAVYVPFIGLHALLLHANVPWSFGPLRRVLSSPLFHRWHHTAQAEGLDKNFGGLFPIWDQLFGTFYMPEGRQPQLFGVIDDDVPGSFLAQLAYPFRSGAGSNS